MEKIRFERVFWVDKFLDNEGKTGEVLSDFIEGLQGAILENLVKADVLGQVHSKPQVFSLKKKHMKTFYRFLGPKIGSSVYLLYPFKKKTNRIEQHDLKTALKRAEDFLRLKR
jgi:hypothetical protein